MSLGSCSFSVRARRCGARLPMRDVAHDLRHKLLGVDVPLNDVEIGNREAALSGLAALDDFPKASQGSPRVRASVKMNSDAALG